MDASGFHFYGISGAGDIIGCLPDGRHYEVETKAGRGGRLSVAQQRRQREVEYHNGVYLVVHSVEELADGIGLFLEVNDASRSNTKLFGPEGPAEDGQ